MPFYSDPPSDFKAATMPDYGGGNQFDAFEIADFKPIVLFIFRISHLTKFIKLQNQRLKRT